jgi:hypothetical protein
MTDKPEVLLAFLHMPRQTCVGCSEFLVERGLIEVIDEYEMPVMNAPPGSTVVRHYRMKDGVTLADCQNAVRGRHRGPRPWGLE